MSKVLFNNYTTICNIGLLGNAKVPTGERPEMGFMNYGENEDRRFYGMPLAGVMPESLGGFESANVLIIDVDVKEGKVGWESLAQLEEDMWLGENGLRDLAQVQTGSGGIHIYVLVEGDKFFAKAQEKYPDIDFIMAHSDTRMVNYAVCGGQTLAIDCEEDGGFGKIYYDYKLLVGEDGLTLEALPVVKGLVTVLDLVPTEEELAQRVAKRKADRLGSVGGDVEELFEGMNAFKMAMFDGNTVQEFINIVPMLGNAVARGDFGYDNSMKLVAVVKRMYEEMDGLISEEKALDLLHNIFSHYGDKYNPRKVIDKWKNVNNHQPLEVSTIATIIEIAQRTKLGMIYDIWDEALVDGLVNVKNGKTTLINLKRLCEEGEKSDELIEILSSEPFCASDGVVLTEFIDKVNANLLRTDKKKFDYDAYNTIRQQACAEIEVIPDLPQRAKLFDGFDDNTDIDTVMSDTNILRLTKPEQMVRDIGLVIQCAMGKNHQYAMSRRVQGASIISMRIDAHGSTVLTKHESEVSILNDERAVSALLRINAEMTAMLKKELVSTKEIVRNYKNKKKRDREDDKKLDEAISRVAELELEIKEYYIPEKNMNVYKKFTVPRFLAREEFADILLVLGITKDKIVDIDEIDTSVETLPDDILVLGRTLLPDYIPYQEMLAMDKPNDKMILMSYGVESTSYCENNGYLGYVVEDKPEHLAEHLAVIDATYTHYKKVFSSDELSSEMFDIFWFKILPVITMGKDKERLKFMTILSTGEGLGKSVLLTLISNLVKHPIQSMFIPQNKIFDDSQSGKNSGYISLLQHRSMLLIEELANAEAHSNTGTVKYNERFKMFCDGGSVPNKEFGKKETSNVSVDVSIFAATNNPRPIALDEGVRRVFNIQSFDIDRHELHDFKQSSGIYDEYQKLYDVATNGCRINHPLWSAFRQYFKDLYGKLSPEDKYNTISNTWDCSTQQLQEQIASDNEMLIGMDEMRSMIADNQIPYATKDFLITSEVLNTLKSRIGYEWKDRYRLKLFKALGYISKDNHTRQFVKKVRLNGNTIKTQSVWVRKGFDYLDIPTDIGVKRGDFDQF